MIINQCNLNVTLHLPKEIWDKVPLVYKNMNGWLGFKDGIPFWFSYNENEKSIHASAEASGLHFEAKMSMEEWFDWKSDFKRIASEILGFNVVEMED